MALKLLTIATFVMSLILAVAVHVVWIVSYVGARCLGRTVAYGPFGWTPASWMFRQTDGRYDIGSQTLYINIGLGCTAPVRLGANPEITLITLGHACPVCKNGGENPEIWED